jgi:hypothetical protein
MIYIWGIDRVHHKHALAGTSMLIQGSQFLFEIESLSPHESDVLAAVFGRCCGRDVTGVNGAMILTPITPWRGMNNETAKAM